MLPMPGLLSRQQLGNRRFVSSYHVLALPIVFEGIARNQVICLFRFRFYRFLRLTVSGRWVTLGLLQTLGLL